MSLKSDSASRLSPLIVPSIALVRHRRNVRTVYPGVILRGPLAYLDEAMIDRTTWCRIPVIGNSR